MTRRELTLLGGSAAASPFLWPLAAHAQQARVPVVGFLSSAAPEPGRAAAFVKGLGETGYVEGHNIRIEYRWANNETARLPELAADLARRRVAAIAAMQTSSALLAKTATSSIPIVFLSAADAVEAGVVASLSRPTGNLTGINTMATELVPKQLGLLHELLPRATRFALLGIPGSSIIEASTKSAQEAAGRIGGSIEVFSAATPQEIDAIFARLAEKRVDAVMMTVPNQLFFNRRVQLATASARYMMPVIFYDRVFADAGGLMSYGANIDDLYRQIGIYVGRILKGEKPSDLPVAQPTKFELVINLETARLLGIEVPPTLHAIADEVID
jgi:putative ABC transport system substrate-binding protein